jgi:hypothetical protein
MSREQLQTRRPQPSGGGTVAVNQVASVDPLVAHRDAPRILGRGRHLHLLRGRSRHTISFLVGPAVDLDTGGDEGNSMEALYGAAARVVAAIATQPAVPPGEATPRLSQTSRAGAP